MHAVGQDFSGRGEPPALTAAQDAAVAKLRYVAGEPGAIAVLCGPAGVGKTTVLARVGNAGTRCRSVRLSSGGCRPETRSDTDAAVDASEAARATLLLVDDADRVEAAFLRGFLEEQRRREPDRGVVLAGTGRLLTMLSGDPAVERAVRLRVVVPVLTISETARIVLMRWPSAPVDDEASGVIRTIHEIAGGVARAVHRLADVAAMLEAAEPGRPITAEDVETIHRRLSPLAA